MKTCRKCGYPKPLNQFRKDKKFSDGHRNICEVCRLSDEDKTACLQKILSTKWVGEYADL